MHHLEVDDEWNCIHSSDLWVYNKLILSRILGYSCGPAGTTVPKSDFYIIRPCINFLGMSRFARIEWIENNTEHLHPSEFWCEVFKGEHLSVDFYQKIPKLVIKGTKKETDPLYKWNKWEKVNKKINFPKILDNLIGNYDWINCEFIENHLIEVHFRQNPDFRYGNSIAIPIWEDEIFENKENYYYIKDPDYKRKGFFIK
jgi:hypothetical protein